MFRGLKRICVAYGVYKIVEATYNLGKSGYIYYVKPDEGIKGKVRQGYAVVTGSTQGIGKDYAKSLAQRGFNLVLISRDEECLRKVQEELSNEYKVDVKVIGFDFKEDSPALYEEKIFSHLRSLDISVLVNNVGMMSSPKRFESQCTEEINNMLVVNDLSTAYLTNFYLKKLAATRNKGLGKNLIVNLGSMTGYNPFPFKSTYAASKRFVQDFSQALSFEVGGNILTQALTPGMVDTGRHRPELSGNLSRSNLFKWQRVPSVEITENSLKNVEHDLLSGSMKHDITIGLFGRLGMAANEFIRLWNFYLIQTL